MSLDESTHTRSGWNGRLRRVLGSALVGLLLAACAAPAANLKGPARTGGQSLRGKRPNIVSAIFQANGLGVVSWNPLWVGWSNDRTALESLTAAWRHARRATSVPNPAAAAAEYGGGPLQLYFSDGKEAFLAPYRTSVDAKGFPTWSKDVVLADVGGRWEALRSPTLAAASLGQGFAKSGQTPPVTVSAGSVVTIRGSDVLGPLVKVTIAPQFGDGLGQGSPVAGFTVGTATVSDGAFTWRGKIAVPPSFRAFHSVSGWWVYVEQFHPIPGARAQLLDAGLPPSVLPTTPASPVLSPQDALLSVGQLQDPFYEVPHWPSAPGVTQVTWRSASGNVVHATERISVTADGQGYRVAALLTYRTAGSHSALRITWQVPRRGAVTVTHAQGRQPTWQTAEVVPLRY